MATVSCPTIPDTIPSSQNAVIVQNEYRHVFSHSRSIPTLTPASILVKVMAVAINPVDAKLVDIHGPSLNDCVGGYDFSGYIIAIGSEVVQQHFRIRDRVAGIVLGNNPLRPDVGAFCEYVLADPRFLLKQRDTMSFEEGATLGVAVATAGIALYQSLELKISLDRRFLTSKESSEEFHPTQQEWVLVIGGSTASGTMAIQMLKLSGYMVIATASNKNHSLVYSYGADYVVDHNSTTCASDIKKCTSNILRIALDCVSDNETIKMCYEVIGPMGGRYTGLNPFPIRLHTRSEIKPHWVFILTMFGQPFDLKGPFNRPKPRQKDVDFGTKWFGTVQKMLDQGLIRTHPIKRFDSGLEGVPEGIDLVRLGKISGEKLVYTLHSMNEV